MNNESIVNEISVLSVKPGDIVLVKMDMGGLSPDEASERFNRLNTNINERFPDIDFLIVERDYIDFSVIRKEGGQ